MAFLLEKALGSSLVISSVSAADAGIYSVVVSGVCGSPVTNSASLTVNENVIVATAPVSLTNCPGTTASFSVSATGTGLSYQWYKGATTLSGQTTSSLILSSVSAADAGVYHVVVSGTCGTPVTNGATLTVNENVLVVTAPMNQTNCPGTTATFSVSATGTGLSYQWFKGATLLSGETGSSLVIPAISAADAGIYTIVVKGTCGVPVTNSATLTVNENLLVVTAPVSLTNCPGTTASFSVSATGTGLRYQWYKGSMALVGGFFNSPLKFGALAFSFGAQVAEVEVDPRTGSLKVIRVTAAHDIGRAINPLAVEGQLDGKVFSGMSKVLFEECRVDDGQVLNPSRLEYKLPRTLEMPEVDYILVETVDPYGPFGAKEVGEGPIVVTMSAVANAVANALGGMMNEMPMTPWRVMRVLRSRRRQSQREDGA